MLLSKRLPLGLLELTACESLGRPFPGGVGVLEMMLTAVVGGGRRNGNPILTWMSFCRGLTQKLPLLCAKAVRASTRCTRTVASPTIDAVAELVRAGWQANVACDKIYEVYGHNESVTKIINGV